MLEDASELEQGKPYHWHDWCVVRSRDCLYLWNESCALELSNGSNGWFRFILDGKLATMYSSGSPEGGSDSSGIYKLQITGIELYIGPTTALFISILKWSFKCVVSQHWSLRLANNL